MFTNLRNRRGKVKTYRVPVSDVSTNKKRRYILYDYYGNYVDSGSVKGNYRKDYNTFERELIFRNGREYIVQSDAVIYEDQCNWRERFINI